MSIPFFYSCNKEKYYKVKPSFSTKKELIATKHFINEVMFPDFMTMSENILSISSTTSDTMLFHYLVPEMKLIKGNGTKGNAFDEFSAFPMFCHTPINDELYIWGYKPNIIKKFAVTEQNNLEYVESFIIDYESFNNMNIIRDSLLIYYLIDNLEIKKKNLHKNTLIDNVKLKKDDHKESYFYSNRGMIVANDSIIVHAYLFKNRIDIYDIETLELKAVIEDKKDPTTITLGDFDNLEYHYINLVAGKEYFYALYSGQKNNDKSKDKNRIQVYDFKGKSIIEYEFDIPPLIFVVDEKNQMMYGFNGEYQDYLLSYEM